MMHLTRLAVVSVVVLMEGWQEIIEKEVMVAVEWELVGKIAGYSIDLFALETWPFGVEV
jgi:hypothetical protein